MHEQHPLSFVLSARIVSSVDRRIVRLLTLFVKTQTANIHMQLTFSISTLSHFRTHHHICGIGLLTTHQRSYRHIVHFVAFYYRILSIDPCDDKLAVNRIQTRDLKFLSHPEPGL